MHFAHDRAVNSGLSAPACTDSGQMPPDTAPEPSFPHTSQRAARAKKSWTLTPIRHWIGVPTDRSESAASATRQPAHEIPSCAPCAYFVCWGILANLECIHTQRIGYRVRSGTKGWAPQAAQMGDATAAVRAKLTRQQAFNTGDRHARDQTG